MAEKKSTVIWEDRRHILWFPITFDKYRIANGRIYCSHGLLRQEEHECLIYRILDISHVRTISNRICGTGTIVLRTKDASDPVLTIKNVKDSQRIKAMISDLVEAERELRNVAGREMFGAGGGPGDAMYHDAIDDD